MPFPDESFRLVVFDPPHLVNVGKTSWLAKKYGRLDKKTWRDDLRRGFEECIRVLMQDGVLIVKWSTVDIPASDLWRALGRKPLFGSVCGKSGRTLWGVFMKGVKDNERHAALSKEVKNDNQKIIQTLPRHP